MSEWQKIGNAPVGPVVWTKIDDDKGTRNEAPLFKSGNLWFVPDGSMYVYYGPTHWRHLTREEELVEVEKATKKYAADMDGFKKAVARITGTA
jgi:hypothetical protein